MSRHPIPQHFRALGHEGLERFLDTWIERRPLIVAQPHFADGLHPLPFVRRVVNYVMLVAGCAAFATVLPSFLINAGLGRITPQASAMISPLVTIILAVIFLGEAFTFLDAIGTALIVLGVGVYAWSLVDLEAKQKPKFYGGPR